MKYFLFPLLLILTIACRQKPSVQEPATKPSLVAPQTYFLDIKTGQEAITIDNMEHFFDKINVRDISLQLKKDLQNSSKEEALKEYKKSLKEGVLEFTKEEKKNLAPVFKKAFDYCNAINPNIFPDSLKLIKTDGRHYGEFTYYTREKCIIIPEYNLGEASIKGESFFTTMLHEIFHIYSRLNPEKRKELYALIGFYYLEGIQFSKHLKENILINPDGLDLNVVIDLKDEAGATFQAIPLNYSKPVNFKNNKSNLFFSSLDFQLYKIQAKDTGFSIVSNKDASTTLNLDELPDFFEQIGPNTDYIIHPDEVLADNFYYLAFYKQDKSYGNQFKPEGLELIKQIQAVMEK